MTQAEFVRMDGMGTSILRGGCVRIGLIGGRLEGWVGKDRLGMIGLG